MCRDGARSGPKAAKALCQVNQVAGFGAALRPIATQGRSYKETRKVQVSEGGVRYELTTNEAPGDKADGQRRQGHPYGQRFQ